MRSLALALGTSAFVAASVITAYAGPKGIAPHGGGSKPTTAHRSPHPTTTRTTTGPRLNPIASKISSHPQLASKVTAMLPPGMTLNQASRGFKNQGQFIAALHVSQNLGIPFTQLRTAMVRRHESLGQAIHQLRPTTDAKSAARSAQHDADADLHTTAPTTSHK